MRGLTVPRQRINLYRKAPGRDTTTPLQPTTFALVAALGLLLLLGSYLVLQLQIDALHQERDQDATQVAAYRQQLGQLQARVPSADADPVLMAELQRLQASQAQVAQAIRLIEQHRQLGSAGFAELFRGLARHRVEGLWLQDISLAANGEEFVLRGKAVQAALVPRLLRSLGSEAVFSGRTFREVNFERPADQPGGPLIFELRSRREETDAG